MLGEGSPRACSPESLGSCFFIEHNQLRFLSSSFPLIKEYLIYICIFSRVFLVCSAESHRGSCAGKEAKGNTY